MSEYVEIVSLKIGDPCVLRTPREQAALTKRLFHQGLGVSAGALEAQRGQGIDLAIDLTDAALQHVEQIEGGQVA